MRRAARGMMLVDLVMALAVLGIVMLAVMPSANPGESMKLVAATTILTADIEYAQSQTLARPADPTILRFDEDGNRYWLALASDPDSPILRPNGTGPYEVVFGEGAFRQLWGVTVEVQDIPDQIMVFDAMGRLVQSASAVIRLGNSNGELAVVVRATTGSVSVVEGSEVPPSEGAGPGPQGDPGPGTGDSGPGTGGPTLPPTQPGGGGKIGPITLGG